MAGVESVCWQQPLNVSGGCLTVWWPWDRSCFSVSRSLLWCTCTDFSFVLLTLSVTLFSWHHTPRALTSSLQVINQAYHCSVVCKLDDWVGGVHGHEVVGEQGALTAANHVYVTNKIWFDLIWFDLKLPALQDTYTTRCHRKAIKIIKDNNHPSHCLFTPLSSRRRGQNRCIKAGTERLKNSFYLKAIRLLNSHHQHWVAAANILSQLQPL